MKTQFIVDNKGKRVGVILSISEYDKLIEGLEELENIRLYDAAIKEDNGKRILLTDYRNKRKLKNG